MTDFIPTFDFTLPGETWRAVADTPSNFVSNLGRVASFRPLDRDGRGRPVGGGRLLKANPGVVGYLRHGFAGKTRYVHRMVADAFLPPQPSPDHEITFIDEDVTNCRFDNLIWLTPVERIAKRRAAGTWTRDTNIGNTILTKDDVREVRRDLAAGMMGKDVAAKFGVGRKAISKIKTGLTWSHVA